MGLRGDRDVATRTAARENTGLCGRQRRGGAGRPELQQEGKQPVSAATDTRSMRASAYFVNGLLGRWFPGLQEAPPRAACRSEWPDDDHDDDDHQEQRRHLVGDPVEPLRPAVAVLQEVTPPARGGTVEAG